MRYIICCGPGIGDLILILPMAYSLRAHDPNCYIKMVTTSTKERMAISKTLFKLQDAINDIDYYSGAEKVHSIGFLLKNGLKSFDFGFVLQYTDNEHTSTIPNKIIRIAAKKTCGVRVCSNPSIVYDYYIDRKKGTRIADNPLLMLRKVGIPVLNEYGSLLKNELLIDSMPVFDYNKQSKNIAICVGTAPVSVKINGVPIIKDSKNWDYKNWLDLSNKLASSGYNVLLLGGNKEQKEILPFLSGNQSPNIHNFLGKCTIIESLSLLSISDIVVGADTGLMHCAGALDKKSLTLFGCTDYNEYLPFGNKSEYITAGVDCSPCFGTDMSVLCKNKKCMNNITIEMVYDRIIKMLNK